MLFFGVPSSGHLDDEKVNFPNSGEAKPGCHLGTTGRNASELSRNTSVQPVHSFSSWLLSDCTFMHVAVKAAVSLWWNALVLRACESGSVFASLSLLCDFVWLRMAGKIKDHSAFYTFVIFSFSPTILSFPQFNLCSLLLTLSCCFWPYFDRIRGLFLFLQSSCVQKSW